MNQVKQEDTSTLTLVEFELKFRDIDKVRRQHSVLKTAQTVVPLV